VKREVLRPFLEKALAEWAGCEQVEPDQDGDYGFRRGSAQFFVRLTNDDPPVLRFFSVLLKKVKPTPRVFRLLNSLNAALLFARVYWNDDSIILSMEMTTDEVDTAQVAQACEMIGHLADDLDTRLKKDVGGRTTFPDEPEDDGDAVRV
jgi:hypothetical protein